MTHIEQLHLDAIKYEEVSCMTQDGEYIEFVENSNYYDVAVKSAEITEQIAIEFGKWISDNCYEDFDLKDKMFYSYEGEWFYNIKDLFEEFLKTKP